MRIVTRPDFDGIVSAVLLSQVEPIDEPVEWVEPGDLQHDRVAIRPGDIIANLPHHPACSLWFDHHYTNRTDRPFAGRFAIAPSAAGLIHAHYRDRIAPAFIPLVAAADKIDAARLTRDEVLRPEAHPYVLLSMTITNRRRQEAPYWNHLVALLGREPGPGFMHDGRVAARCRRTVEQNARFETLLRAHTRVQDNVSITDFRPLGGDPPGNRFLVYALYPGARVSVKIRYAENDPDTLVVSAGHSIFTPGCRVHIGLLMSACRGGGHRGAGACSFPADRADTYLPVILDTLTRNLDNEAGRSAP